MFAVSSVLAWTVKFTTPLSESGLAKPWSLALGTGLSVADQISMVNSELVAAARSRSTELIVYPAVFVPVVNDTALLGSVESNCWSDIWSRLLTSVCTVSVWACAGAVRPTSAASTAARAAGRRTRERNESADADPAGQRGLSVRRRQRCGPLRPPAGRQVPRIRRQQGGGGNGIHLRK